MWLKGKLARYGKNKRWDSKNKILIFLVVFLTQALTNGATKGNKTCSQIGAPESNVTLMKGLYNPAVEHFLIGHVRSLEECVEIACRRENVSLAYTSRFDCYAIRCNGDEEDCWLLPSFKNPTLVFARLHRGITLGKHDTSKRDRPRQSKQNSEKKDIDMNKKRKKREKDDSLVDFLTGLSDKTVSGKPTEFTLVTKRTKRSSELPYDWKRRRKVGSRFRRYFIKNDIDSENEAARPAERSSTLKNDENNQTEHLNNSTEFGNTILERVKRDIDEDDGNEEKEFKDVSSEKTPNPKATLERFKRENLEEEPNDDFQAKGLKNVREVQRFKRKVEDDHDEEDEYSSGFLSRILETRDTDSNSNDVLDLEAKNNQRNEEHSDSLRRYKRKALQLKEMDELGKALSTDSSSNSDKGDNKETRSFPQSQSSTSTSSIVISGPSTSSSTSSKTSSSTQSATNPSSSQTSTSQISTILIKIPIKDSQSPNKSHILEGPVENKDIAVKEESSFPQSQSGTSTESVVISGAPTSSSTSSKISSSTQSATNPSSSQTSTSQISNMMIRIPKSKDKQSSSPDNSHNLGGPVDNTDGYVKEKRSFPQSQSSTSAQSVVISGPSTSTASKTSSSTQSATNPSSSQTSTSQISTIMIRIPIKDKPSSPPNKPHMPEGPLHNRGGQTGEQKRSISQSKSSSSTSSTSSSTQSSTASSSSLMSSSQMTSSASTIIIIAKDTQTPQEKSNGEIHQATTNAGVSSQGPQKASAAPEHINITLPIIWPNLQTPPQTLKSTSKSPMTTAQSDVKTPASPPAQPLPAAQTTSSSATAPAPFLSSALKNEVNTKKNFLALPRNSPTSSTASIRTVFQTILPPSTSTSMSTSTFTSTKMNTSSKTSKDKPQKKKSTKFTSSKGKLLDTGMTNSTEGLTQFSKSKKKSPRKQKKTFSAAPQSSIPSNSTSTVIAFSKSKVTSTKAKLVKSSEKDKQLKRKEKGWEGKKSSAIPQKTATATATAVLRPHPPPPPHTNPPPPSKSVSSSSSLANPVISDEDQKKTKTRKHTKSKPKVKTKSKAKDALSSETLKDVPEKKFGIKGSNLTKQEQRPKRNSKNRNEAKDDSEDNKITKRQAIHSVFPYNTANAYQIKPRVYNTAKYNQHFIQQQKSQVNRPIFSGYPVMQMSYNPGKNFQSTAPRAQKLYTGNSLRVPEVDNVAYQSQYGPAQQRSGMQPWAWKAPNTMPYQIEFHPLVQGYGDSNRYGSRGSIPSKPLTDIQAQQNALTQQKPDSKDESCNSPVGMQSGQIRPEQLTSSSDFSRYHTATRGRLEIRPDQTGQAGAWCAAKDHIDRFQYLQIDLGKRQKICRVATQGMAEFPIWVTEYALEFGNNGHIWADYTEDGREKTFIGNSNSATPVSHSLKQPITARYIRFKPKSWNGASICMRTEVYTSQDQAMTASDERKLVAYLNFDKNDSTGDELDKRMKVAEMAGTCGDAGNFHNGNTVVLDVSKIQPKPRDAITIAAWIRLDDIKGQHSIFDTIGGHSTHSDGQYHFEVSDGKLRWYHRNETAHRIFSVESDAIISPNTWTHVAGTYDAHTGTSKVFIDGHMNGESQGSGLLSQDWDSHAGIGRHKGYRFLDGQVDEFRIYNYAMDQDGIQKLMKTCDYKDPNICGGALTSSQGSIVTPEWQTGYKGAKSCTWTINVGQRDTIVLNFESFALQEDGNCDKSKFIVKDGESEDGDELGEFCGLNSPKVMQSKTNKLWLHFASTDQGEGKGFRLTYETKTNPQSKKEVRPHAGKTLKCSASTVENNVTLIGGIKAGSFSEALGVENLDMCMRQCCLKESCDLAFMISKSCYLVDCLNDDLCKTKKARPSNMNPTIVYINHLKESPLDLHTGLADEPATSLAPPTPKAPSCHHTDVVYNVTLVGGIKAGKFNTFGHMNSIDDCIRHCCHDEKCDVAFMIQNNCYNVECENRMACQMKKAKPSRYNPTLAYVYRGDKKPLAEPAKKVEKPTATSCSAVSITPTLYNVTLMGGVTSGKFSDKGVVNSMDECKAYCCADDTCNVAFLIRRNCFLVACKDYELCKVKQAVSGYYHPKLAYVNWNPPDDEVKSNERFASLGCWRDTAAFAIPSLEGTDSVLMSSYMTRVKPIDTCASVAYKRGYKVFAIQNGGACLSGAKADETFNKYGESPDCKMGKGGVGVNDVYRMNYDGSYSKVGCWRDSETRAMTELESTDARLKDPYQTRASPLVKCADVARQQGYPVFAIQDGGRCMSGPAAEDSYKQFGISRDCRGVLGGSYANSVYKLIGKFDLQEDTANNNSKEYETGSNKGNLSKPNNLVVSEDPALPGKTSSTSQIEDFVTMKNGQPQRIVYTAGKIHFNETLKYGIKSGKFMDKGRVQNISQCISLCGRQPDCDLAFMLGTQCYAVSCESNLLCATKPAYSAFYNPAIVFVTNRKVFSVVQSKKKKCHVSAIRKDVTLVGGINAGKFENLGKISDMNSCIKRCCAKKTCDVAFLLEEECYGVSCLSNELCKTRPAKNPWRYQPQIAYTYHDAEDAETVPNLQTVYASQLHDKHVQDQRQMYNLHVRNYRQHEHSLKTAFANLDRTNSTDNKNNNSNISKISKNLESKSFDKNESKDNDQSNSPIYGGLRDYSQVKVSTLMAMVKQLEDAMEKGLSKPNKTRNLFDIGASQTETNKIKNAGKKETSFGLHKPDNDRITNKSKTKNVSSSTDHQHIQNNINNGTINSIGNKTYNLPMQRSYLTRNDPQRSKERGIFVKLDKHANEKITYLKEESEKPTYVNSKKTRITELGVLTQIQATDNTRHKHVNGQASYKQPYGENPYVQTPNVGYTYLKQHHVKSSKERQGIHDMYHGDNVNGQHVTVKPTKIAPNEARKDWKMGHKIDISGLKKIHLQIEQSAVKPLLTALHHDEQQNIHTHKQQGQTTTNHGSSPKSKPNISSKYFPAIGQTTTQGNAGTVCWDGSVNYNKTLIGGINSGVFKDNGKATTMDMCMQFCCKRGDCDLAFMIEDDCYSVACSSPSSCKMRTARPTQFYPRISYTKKFNELMKKEKSGVFVTTAATTQSTSATQMYSSPTPTISSSGSLVPSTTAGPTLIPTVHVQHSCVATPTKYNVTLKMGLHSGLFTKMGRVDSMDDCIELNCKQSKADVAFMMGTHCFSVQCYSADLCKTEPVFATSFSRLNLKPAVSFLSKSLGSNGPALALQDNPRETCLESPITYNVTLRGGIKSGKFVERLHARSMRKCISECCDAVSCDLAFMFGDRCYSVTCDTEKACQAVLAKPTFLYPRIAYMNRNTLTNNANEGVSLAESEETVHPQCHNDFNKNIIAKNKTLVGGLEAGTFKFLGKVKTMDICMRKCCSRPTCDVAYLIDKNCFSVRCFSHDLCKISTAPSVTNGDVEISAMRRTVKKDELPEDSHSVVVYIIVGALMFAAGLGGIVWAVCMFLRRHRLRQRHRSRRPSEG